MVVVVVVMPSAARSRRAVPFVPIVRPGRLRRALGLVIAQAKVLVQPFGHDGTEAGARLPPKARRPRPWRPRNRAPPLHGCAPWRPSGSGGCSCSSRPSMGPASSVQPSVSRPRQKLLPGRCLRTLPARTEKAPRPRSGLGWARLFSRLKGAAFLPSLNFAELPAGPDARRAGAAAAPPPPPFGSSPAPLPRRPCPDGRTQRLKKTAASRVRSRLVSAPARPPKAAGPYARHAPVGRGLRTEMPPPLFSAVRARRAGALSSSWEAVGFVAVGKRGISSSDKRTRGSWRRCSPPEGQSVVAKLVCAIIFSSLRLSLCVREGRSCSWRSTCNRIRFLIQGLMNLLECGCHKPSHILKCLLRIVFGLLANEASA